MDGLSFGAYINTFSNDDQPKQREAVLEFLDPKDGDVRSYILQYLNTYFLIESSSLSSESLKLIERTMAKTPTFNVLLDTNFLFYLLDLDDGQFQSVSDLLRRLISNVRSRVRINLYVLPITVQEAKSKLLQEAKALSEIRATSELSNAAVKSGMVSGITGRFFKEAVKTKYGLNASDYFRPYINNTIQVLKSKGIELLDEKAEDLKTLQEVQDDISRQKAFYKSQKNVSGRWRGKSDAVIEHDILLWHFTKSKRPDSYVSPIEANYWLISIDSSLMGFDRFKMRLYQTSPAVCVSPSAFIQMLQLWLPRTPEFERAIISSIRPLLTQTFESEAEEMTLSILRTVSMFEDVGNLDSEVIVNTLTDESLHERLKTQKEHDDIELVRSSLAEQFENQKQKLESLQQLVEDKEKSIDSLYSQLETVETESRLNQQLLEAQLHDTVRELEEKQNLNQQNETEKANLAHRLGLLEHAEKARQARSLQFKFWLVCVLPWIAGFIVLVTVVDWLLPLLRLAGQGQVNNEKILIVGVPLTLYIIYVLIALIYVERAGIERPYINETSIFQKYRKLKGWLLSIVLLGVVINLLSERISSIWQ